VLCAFFFASRFSFVVYVKLPPPGAFLFSLSRLPFFFVRQTYEIGENVPVPLLVVESSSLRFCLSSTNPGFSRTNSLCLFFFLPKGFFFFWLDRAPLLPFIFLMRFLSSFDLHCFFSMVTLPFFSSGLLEQHSELVELFVLYFLFLLLDKDAAPFVFPLVD